MNVGFSSRQIHLKRRKYKTDAANGWKKNKAFFNLFVKFDRVNKTPNFFPYNDKKRSMRVLSTFATRHSINKRDRLC
jgi:hypothetical protein